MRPLLRFGAGIALVSFASGAAAHDMTLETAVVGETLSVLVGYEDGSKAAGAQVAISDDERAEIARLQTDARGAAHVPLTSVAHGAVIEAFDDDGHAAYVILTPADLQALRQ